MIWKQLGNSERRVSPGRQTDRDLNFSATTYLTATLGVSLCLAESGVPYQFMMEMMQALDRGDYEFFEVIVVFLVLGS